jgi:hypothetical protein
VVCELVGKFKRFMGPIRKDYTGEVEDFLLHAYKVPKRAIAKTRRIPLLSYSLGQPYVRVLRVQRKNSKIERLYVAHEQGLGHKVSGF